MVEVTDGWPDNVLPKGTFTARHRDAVHPSRKGTGFSASGTGRDVADGAVLKPDAQAKDPLFWRVSFARRETLPSLARQALGFAAFGAGKSVLAVADVEDGVFEGGVGEELTLATALGPPIFADRERGRGVLRLRFRL